MIFQLYQKDLKNHRFAIIFFLALLNIQQKIKKDFYWFYYTIILNI